jgi:hypothetical protein
MILGRISLVAAEVEAVVVVLAVVDVALGILRKKRKMMMKWKKKRMMDAWMIGRLWQML